MRNWQSCFLAAVGFLCAIALGIATPAAAQSDGTTLSADVPPHAKLASFGVVLGLRGKTATPDGLPVVLTSEVRKELLEPEFRFDGFMVSTIQMESFAPIENEPDAYRLLGLIVFEDAAARRVHTEFAAYYSVTDTGIVIDWASARTRTPESATILWFAVEKNDHSPEQLEPKNQIGLMRLLETSALKAASDSQDGEIVIYAVSMERFAERDMPITTATPSDVSASVFDLGGWPAAVFTAPAGVQISKESNTLELIFPDGRLLERIDSFPTPPNLFK